MGIRANNPWFTERLFMGPLTESGYKVGVFGKWLNTRPDAPPLPFDAWFANYGGQVSA